MFLSDRQPHIVFQVFNFIYGSECENYDLLPIDKLLVIALAKHHGAKGIYPAVKTLANELKVSYRYVTERLSYLESINLIEIERNIGTSNNYHLLCISPNKIKCKEKVIHSPCTPVHTEPQYTPEPQFIPPLNQSSDPPRTVVHPNSKEGIVKKNSRERRKERAHPLPDDFLPTLETQAVAWEDAGLSKEEARFEFKKFKSRYKDSGEIRSDWQLHLQKWFMGAAEYKKNQLSKMSSYSRNDEIRSTVPWYKPNNEKYDKMEYHEEIAVQSLQEIMAKLNMTSKGVLHGQSREEGARIS